MKIGIDIGGSHIAVGVISEEGKILKKLEKDISFIDLKKEKIEIEIRDTIVSLINHVLKEISLPIFMIEEIGIGLPGIIEENKIKKCEKFGLKDIDLAKSLEEYYGIKVKLKNDAECAAIAEYVYGNLVNTKKAVFLCLGTGIGGATILDGIILPSEYGHMIIEKQGRRCHCGNQGCFETYCSMRAFKRGIVELLQLNGLTSSQEILNILKAEIKKDIVNKYIDEYTEDLIVGMTNIINSIHPEVICFGGGFVYFQDILYKRLLEKIQLHHFEFERPKLILARLGNDAGMIGATISKS